MTKHTDTIILNGKHFNARTGQPVKPALSSSQSIRNVDGILPDHVAAATLQKPDRYIRPLKSSVKKPVMDVARTPAQQAPKHPQQPGQTLTRRTLAKPQASLKRRTPLNVTNQASSAVSVKNTKRKTSAARVDGHKLRHAQNVAKSTLITRFSSTSASFSKSASLTKTASHAVVASQQVAQHLAKQSSMDIFKRALHEASTQRATTPDHVNRSLKKADKIQRRLNLAASSLAVLLIAGFIGYQQLPAMKFQYASSRAGFHAQLPSYQPSGFSLGKLTYQTGAVSVNYHSNSDDRAFAIVQKPSAWDSQTLRENFVASSGQQYHSAVVGGRTIYMYGDNNATWVNAGVWYRVQGGGSLNERQLTQLAASM